MNPQVERAVEHFRALLEEQIARAERLERAGLEVYTHSRVSTNDEGLSLGQLKILEARYVLGGTAEDR